jgi:ArsR family metal-binding transcriptional regulator
MSDRQRVTTKLEGERLDYFQQVKNEEGAESNAETMRAIVDRAMAHGDARDRADRLENRVDELQAELRAANRRIDSANEIVEYVEAERSWEERRRQAGLLTRTKWFLLGAGDND